MVCATMTAREVFVTILDAIGKFFTPKLDGYTNFDVGTGSFLSLPTILMALFVGMVIASFYMWFEKNVVGAPVRRLLAKKAFSPEEALTLSEIGCAKNPIFRYAILKGTTLRHVIHCREEDAFWEEERRRSAEEQTDSAKKKKDSRTVVFKLPAEERHFYIPEESRYRAELRFRTSGSGIFSFLLTIVFLFLGFVLLVGILPVLLRWLDGAVSLYSIKGNTDFH